MPENKIHVAIAGGGASAILLACKLLENNPDVHVTLIERTGKWAAGVAYSTPYDYHLLNVRAGNMSYSENDPGHFVNWLQEKKHAYTATDFVPRKLYGVYLLELFERLKTQHASRISCINGEAIALQDAHTFVLRTGETITATHLVLALGNFLPATPEYIGTALKNSPAYFGNPWNFEALNSIPPDARILIIGSGLTMTDCVLHFENRGHRGSIHSLCRHGYAPVSHEKITPVDDAFKATVASLDGLDAAFAHWMKGYRAGLQPAAMADAFRPFVQKLWMQFDARDKQRFVAHLRHLWGTVRHRVPENCFAVLKNMQERGQLRISGGKITTVAAAENGLRITYLPRKKETPAQVEADVIINCTGPSARYETDAPELLRTLLKNGTVRMDASGLGLDVNKQAAVINHAGEVNKNIFALGNLTRGIFWEITAIPEIRKQAAALAALLL